MAFSNPYLADQANAITNQVNTNLQQTVLPGVNSGAQMAGQYGSSRHGIAQGMAINGANQALSNSLAGLYGSAYDADQNRAVQSRGQDLSYDLGKFNGTNTYNLGLGQNANQAYGNETQRMGTLGTLDNNRYQTDATFYTQQRGQDLDQAALGSNLYTQGINNQMNVGNWLYDMGQKEFTAPVTALNDYGNWLNQFSGLGGATNTSTTGGGGLTGALGGALGAAQLANNLGFGGNTNTYNPYTGSGGWSDTSLGNFFYGNGGSGG